MPLPCFSHVIGLTQKLNECNFETFSRWDRKSSENLAKSFLNISLFNRRDDRGRRDDDDDIGNDINIQLYSPPLFMYSHSFNEISKECLSTFFCFVFFKTKQ